MARYGCKMAIYQLLFFGSLPHSHTASGYIWSYNFWTNQDLDSLGTSKWPSEPQFCDRWPDIWQKMARNSRTTVIYMRDIRFETEFSLWTAPNLREAFVRAQHVSESQFPNGFRIAADSRFRTWVVKKARVGLTFLYKTKIKGLKSYLTLTDSDVTPSFKNQR